MRHSRLLAVAHNYAASLASGLGFVIGHWSTDVFAEAAGNADNCIEVDFLNGSVTHGLASRNFLDALKAYKAGFSSFCLKNGVVRRDFSCFRARYFTLGKFVYFTVFVTDRRGKSSIREYEGFPGRRVKVVDPLGRPRPKRSVGK